MYNGGLVGRASPLLDFKKKKKRSVVKHLICTL